MLLATPSKLPLAAPTLATDTEKNLPDVGTVFTLPIAVAPVGLMIPVVLAIPNSSLDSVTDTEPVEAFSPNVAGNCVVSTVILLPPS